MLIEVRFGGDSFILDVDSRFDHTLSRELPFTTTLNVWKEEVYFETPVELDVSGMRSFLKIEPGKLYYWPPGRGFCIFYGLSQPYSPVYPVGAYIGVIGRLRAIEDGVEAIVQPYKPVEAYREYISILESIGFKAVTPLYGGEPSVESVGFIEDKRIAFKMYIEEYGIHIEGEPLFPQNYTPQTLTLVSKLADLLRLERYVRLDLDEDGWITITGYTTGSMLPEAVEELSRAYLKISRAISQIS
ncbi:MAG: cyclophilin-like fold protein [Nitrososphaerota archaeon]|nr:cyclophilin-like fold protein [Candidatus Bathyarchaeota archaeon]MDW8062265.1 cyclophilin-like fold protein [Nitrososphaerota archaeon]